MSRTMWMSVVAAIAILTSCGDRPVFGPGPSGNDANVDAHAEDAGPPNDAGHDAGSDSGIDAGNDGGSDGGFDAGHDGGFDAAMPDAGMDGGSDGGIDGGSDGGSDGGLDGGRRGPAPVLLGSITDLATPMAYVLIGKTGISNVTGSVISGGHLGVSPSDSTAITGFALILDPSNQFSTSVSVMAPWRVYASDYAVPTLANLTMAILGMQTAYTDAAGRPGPDFLNLASGHLAGLTLAPGLYTWGTSVDIAAGITIDGGPNDTWIFQISNDLDLSAATGMVLAGGADASHIWWQVAGQVTMHATSHFEGVILCQTGITMQTGASLHGRALAQSLVALDDNAITAP